MAIFSKTCLATCSRFCRIGSHILLSDNVHVLKSLQNQPPNILVSDTGTLKPSKINLWIYFYQTTYRYFKAFKNQPPNILLLDNVLVL